MHISNVIVVMLVMCLLIPLSNSIKISVGLPPVAASPSILQWQPSCVLAANGSVCQPHPPH